MTGLEKLGWLEPQWPAPSQVKAVMSSRLGGVSLPPYDSMNLATHVGDEPGHVEENRARLSQMLALPTEPLWLNQVHGTTIVDVNSAEEGCEADGSFASAPGRPCVVMTADCLPLLICDRSGSQVAAVHAGWRGLAAGAVEAAIGRFTAPAGELLVWLGVAIGPGQFEVGEEVRQAFMQHDAGAGEAFVPAAEGKYLADIYTLARRRLAMLGIEVVYGGGLCSYSDSEHWYSYRRDKQTGRMASLIWLT